jgi:RNase P subunit RPR2
VGRKAKKRQKRLHVNIMQRVPPSQCPRCKQTLRAATGIADTVDDTKPHPGAVTLCDQCGTWLVFTLEMHLRLATEEEIAQVAPKLRRIAKEIAAMIDAQRPKH